MRVRSCPVCNTPKQSPERVIDGFGIVKCIACNFVYVCNPAKSEAYPDSEEISSIRQSAKNIHFRHLAIKNFLNKKFSTSKNVSVLEVGAGAGSLGVMLNKQMHPVAYQYAGYEPSAPRAKVAHENGLDVVQGYLEQPLSHTVDAVIMDNVLEHIQTPHDLISNIAQSLNPEGVVVIIVPNLHDIRRFLPSWKKKYYWRPRKHISYFTYESLSNLLRQHGLILHSMPLDSEMPFAYRGSMLLSRFQVFPLGLYTYATVSS